ncbi:MAG: efflux RND transporter periplasmic adaptor subunit [Chloroflexi bacterium]|nr:efflux RND transporter periplasmic adaptor subunit [Chloroflexota bacterium]
MKRRIILITSLVIVVLAVAGFFVWQRTSASTTTAKTTTQTATVKRGSLVATVSAAGNVSVVDQSTLAFKNSGRVAKVQVAVGDVVKTSQLLMQQETSDLELALKTAQSNLASATASYAQTKANLNFSLRNAQTELASAKASLDAAKVSAEQNPNSIIVAKASLDKATVTLQQAQGNYNKIAWRGDVGMTTEAATLQSATIEYQSALANYKMTAATINDNSLKQAQATYDKAQVALEQAQKNLETNLQVAQATLDNAQIAVDTAKTNLENVSLVAPIDGVVSAVNFKKGDFAAGESTAIVVVNTDRLQIKVSIAEVDLPKIKIGNPAQVTLDALTGKTYQAKVTAISPVGTVTSGVVNYSITLEMTDPDSTVKPGMTANLNIIVEQRDNVLLVPTRAISTKSNQKVVTVQQKDQTAQKVVTIGLSNDSYVEIMNGVQEGDVVVINQTTTKTTTSTGSTGIPGLGGPSGPPPN